MTGKMTASLFLLVTFVPQSLLFKVDTSDWVDLTYPLSPEFPVNTVVYHPLRINPDKSIATNSWPGTDLDGKFAAFRFLEFYEHTGTHLDAPRHFVEFGKTEEQLTWDQLTGPLNVINIASNVEKANIPKYSVEAEDLQPFIDQNGPIEPKSFVFLNTGWGQHWKNAEKYEKEAVCLGETALDWLFENAPDMLGFGMDVISPECNSATFFRLHTTLLPKEQLIIENVKSSGMDQLPPKGAHIMMFPMHLQDGTGSPTRIIAVKDSAGDSAGPSARVSLIAILVATAVIMTFVTC
ncbi:isatin hydrolase-like isoform X1 [Convolutriloba macropyga]|uniref:isatin hydrolase-like isoform X1 n=2 Tax=Convolutriloba macropyga TaxID=536237 RepID=UPI003F521433